jgi:hypothetical protein
MVWSGQPPARAIHLDCLCRILNRYAIGNERISADPGVGQPPSYARSGMQVTRFGTTPGRSPWRCQFPSERWRASRNNTLVRETVLVLVMCTATACGTGPARSPRRPVRRLPRLIRQPAGDALSGLATHSRGINQNPGARTSWKSADSLTARPDWPRLSIPRGSTSALGRGRS